METINIKKIFKFDGFLRQMLLSFVITLAVSIYFFISGADQPYVMYIFGGLTIIAFVSLVARFIYLLSFKPDSIELIEAKVISTMYYRGTKRIKFSYQYQGINYSKTNMINYTRLTRNIEKESIVDIYVKSEKPKQALLKDFYFETETL